MEKMDAYQIVTAQIIEALKSGNIPWRKPWNCVSLPTNLHTGKAYRGINMPTLSFSPYASPYWVTFKQAQALGGSVQKGEKGRPIVFWSRMIKEDVETGENKPVFLLKRYTVFNVEQCSGLELPEEKKERKADIEAAEKIYLFMPNRPSVSFDGSAAYYAPSRDQVAVPPKSTFHTMEGFYATLYHELVHSTGHASRLNRFKDDESAYFGSESYSKEELVAELGAAFLCAHAGISNETQENSAAYIQGWLRALNDDKRMIMQAASAAQKAADYILNVRD